MTDPANKFCIPVAPGNQGALVSPGDTPFITRAADRLAQEALRALVEAPVDTAFDEFIATGQAPCLATRHGASVADTGGIQLPAGQLDLPRLDATWVANLLSGDRGSEWFWPDFTLRADNDPTFDFTATQRDSTPCQTTHLPPASS